ncbi:hypothetical protein BDY21DRAFT_362112 [Lineolata rhizophorae]|uniref:Uncharacterized protein n=1 Tax=Lineolata rhizophorae TaxID=578093 RepID=A0A6A6P6C2_9PEZI|nr:hypothetical protein BDY21DRAFT_362112 [Lineolata rhizophorae]
MHCVGSCVARSQEKKGDAGREPRRQPRPPRPWRAALGCGVRNIWTNSWVQTAERREPTLPNQPYCKGGLCFNVIRDLMTHINGKKHQRAGLGDGPRIPQPRGPGQKAWVDKYLVPFLRTHGYFRGAPISSLDEPSTSNCHNSDVEMESDVETQYTRNDPASPDLEEVGDEFVDMTLGANANLHGDPATDLPDLAGPPGSVLATEPPATALDLAPDFDLLGFIIAENIGHGNSAHDDPPLQNQSVDNQEIWDFLDSHAALRSPLYHTHLVSSGSFEHRCEDFLAVENHLGFGDFLPKMEDADYEKLSLYAQALTIEMDVDSDDE